jgi:Pectic acid lyase
VLDDRGYSGRLALQQLRILERSFAKWNWRGLQCLVGSALLGLVALPCNPAWADADLAATARLRIEEMGRVFVEKLSSDGGYVWASRVDKTIRRGEGGEVGPEVIWIQPPGTPAIGATLLHLYELTGDQYWLDAAGQSASALVSGQLLSGGWFNYVETGPTGQQNWCYRATGIDGEACKARAENEARNRSTLDDNITQGALGFLLLYDAATAGQNAAVRGAIDAALDRILKVQYPNGAWPVNLDRERPEKGKSFPQQARLPEVWSRTWVKPEGQYYFVLNDNLVSNTIQVLLLADQLLPREEARAAALKAGDFLLGAQLPAPQRGWSQTYNEAMEPVWGRKFEPPAVASSETATAIEALLGLYIVTKDDRYLRGAEEAAEWLRSVQLSTGEWARFYELGSNRPLYVDQEDNLAYSAASVRDGYSFTGNFGIMRVLGLLDEVSSGREPAMAQPWEWIADQTLWGPGASGSASDTEAAIAALVASDDLLATFSEDGLVQSQLFIDAVAVYDRYVSGRD